MLARLLLVLTLFVMVGSSLFVSTAGAADEMAALGCGRASTPEHVHRPDVVTAREYRRSRN